MECNFASFVARDDVGDEAVAMRPDERSRKSVTIKYLEGLSASLPQPKLAGQSVGSASYKALSEACSPCKACCQVKNVGIMI